MLRDGNCKEEIISEYRSSFSQYAGTGLCLTIFTALFLGCLLIIVMCNPEPLAGFFWMALLCGAGIVFSIYILQREKRYQVILTRDKLIYSGIFRNFELNLDDCRGFMQISSCTIKLLMKSPERGDVQINLRMKNKSDFIGDLHGVVDNVGLKKRIKELHEYDENRGEEKGGGNHIKLFLRLILFTLIFSGVLAMFFYWLGMKTRSLQFSFVVVAGIVLLAFLIRLPIFILAKRGLFIRRIGLYQHMRPRFIEWESRNIKAASSIIRFIQDFYPEIELHHLGSSSIPGCGGKGIIDLYAACEEGTLEKVRDTIDTLGFQRQKSRDPFPESRPMRTGAVNYKGQLYQIHLHLVYKESDEFKAAVSFCERMEREPELFEEYVELKKKILADGVRDSLEYCMNKGKFFEKHRIAGAE